MAKGTSRAEATLNSEKIKPVALAIVELRESEGIYKIIATDSGTKLLKNKEPFLVCAPDLSECCDDGTWLYHSKHE